MTFAYANGRAPDIALAPIPGNGRLRRDAAAAWNAMHQAARRDGVELSIIEGSIRRTYRPFSAQVAARQMWCAQGRCGNAAVPGTSNHGWGLTVDLMNMTQRAWIDRRGAAFGWSKKWADAPWEWWHVKYLPGVWHGTVPPPAPRVLRTGCRPGKDVEHLQVLLRRAGFWPKARKTGSTYGLRTRRAVRAFQRKQGMKADAIVGPQTWAALERAAK